MNRALLLAERGRGAVSPNPMVGCVLMKGGRVVGEGWHRAVGGPHAEVFALRRAGARAKGATAYVNLEPCSHWGKTPPCADALIRAGVKRVVAAMKDPNPSVAGRGFAKLRAAGIRVKVALCEKEANGLNRAFVKVHRHGLPYVIWKTAQTLDGKIASTTGVSRWITGPAARTMGHRLRAVSDAVMVGGNTLRKDDPTLSSHGEGPDPLRIVVSRTLDIPRNAQILRGGGPVLFLTGPSPRPDRVKTIESAGGQILKLSIKFSKADFRDALHKISKMNVNQVLLEGGGTLAYSLLSRGLVDEVYAFVAPSFLGGRSAVTSLEGAGWSRPDRGPRLRDVTVSQVGDDLLVRGTLKTPFWVS